MHYRIREVAFGAIGVLIGVFITTAISAQQDRGLGLKVNHVGIYVKDFQQSIDFYTKTLGMREAFVFRDKEGKPTTMYVYVSKDTFLELAPAGPDRPVGVNHVGFQTDSISDTIADLRKRGVMANDPRIGNNHGPLTNIFDPNGLRLEILEFTPDSLQRKAIDAFR